MAEENGKQLWLFQLIVAAVILVALLLVAELVLTRSPETFTQLWLKEPLPLNVEAGEKFSFEFVLANNEGKGIEYSYKVLLAGEQKAVGKILLKNGEQQTLPIELSSENASSEKQKVLVEVSAPEHEEPYSVWFWACIGGNCSERLDGEADCGEGHEATACTVEGIDLV